MSAKLDRATPRLDVQNDYETTLDQFSARTAALRTFLEKYGEHVAEDRKAVVRENIDWLLPFVLARMTEALSKARERTAEVLALEKSKAAVEKAVKAMQPRLLPGSAEESRIELAEKLFKQVEDRARYFFAGVLATLIGNTELAIQDLVSVYYRSNPDRVPKSKDHPFTYEELTKFPDIEAAKQFLVERAVSEMLRRDIESWITIVKELCSLDARYLDEHLPFLVEIAQRRNLCIHNNGIANQIYCRIVDKKRRKNVELGNDLTPNTKYLNAAISRFQLCFTLLIAEAWEKSGGDKTAIANKLNWLAFEYLLDEEWRVAEALSKFVMSDKTIPEQLRLNATLNYWQAMKWRGKYEEVSKEVDRFDTTARSLRYRIPVLALQGNVDDALQLLPQALGSGDIKVVEAQIWPIFRELRDDARFSGVIKPYEPKEPPHVRAGIRAAKEYEAGVESHDDALAGTKTEYEEVIKPSAAVKDRRASPGGLIKSSRKRKSAPRQREV